MGITALTTSSLARPLHKLQRWWQQFHSVPRSVPSLRANHPESAAQLVYGTATATEQWQAATGTVQATCSAADSTLALPAFRRLHARELPRHVNGGAHPNLQPIPKKTPCALPALRVLRRPASLSRHGGLVIAGRMADVCAELDRLAAMEALH